MYWGEGTPSCSKGIPPHHSLLLDIIQSPLSASDIGLINFSLDFVPFCHDTSPDLATWTLAAEACRATDLFELINWDSRNHHVFHPLRDKDACFRFSLLMQWCCDPQCHNFTSSAWERRSDHRRNSLKAVWKPHWAGPQWWSWPTKGRQYQSQQKQRDAGSEICSSTKKLNTLKIKWTIEESRQRQRWIYNFYQEKCVNEGKTIWAHISLFQHSQASALGAKNSNTISSPFSLLYITNAKRKEK